MNGCPVQIEHFMRVYERPYLSEVKWSNERLTDDALTLITANVICAKTLAEVAPASRVLSEMTMRVVDAVPALFEEIACLQADVTR